MLWLTFRQYIYTTLRSIKSFNKTKVMYGQTFSNFVYPNLAFTDWWCRLPTLVSCLVYSWFSSWYRNPCISWPNPMFICGWVLTTKKVVDLVCYWIIIFFLLPLINCQLFLNFLYFRSDKQCSCDLMVPCMHLWLACSWYWD